MKKFAIILVVILMCCAALSLAACDDSQITITVNGKSFVVELADTKAAQQFAKSLPQTISTRSLNGRELYADIAGWTFTNQSEPSGLMEAGDIMLQGENRLIIFYNTDTSNDMLTRIGRVREKDIAAFAEAVTKAVAAADGGKITVKISK